MKTHHYVVKYNDMWDDDFETIEELTEEEYNELVKQFINKIIKLK